MSHIRVTDTPALQLADLESRDRSAVVREADRGIPLTAAEIDRALTAPRSALTRNHRAIVRDAKRGR